MNALPIVLLSVLLGAGAGVATSIALSPAACTHDERQELEIDDTVLLREEVARLTREVEALRQDATGRLAGGPGGSRLPIGEIEEVVRRYLAAQEGLAVPASAGEASGSTEATASPEDLVAQLLDPELDYTAQEAIWARIRESGQLDEVIALMEAYAEENASDPDAQVDAGYAYLQKIFEVGDGPEAGVWAMKADSAFDRALSLDERHWDARFSKAISLSFWPPIFGKQKDAIQQFEVLIGQQEEGVIEDRHSQTYLLLGNLYHQVGQPEKADSMWKRGLEYFPGDAGLLEKFPDQDDH